MKKDRIAQKMKYTIRGGEANDSIYVAKLVRAMYRMEDYTMNSLYTECDNIFGKSIKKLRKNTKPWYDLLDLAAEHMEKIEREKSKGSKKKTEILHLDRRSRSEDDIRTMKTKGRTLLR